MGPGIGEKEGRERNEGWREGRMGGWRDFLPPSLPPSLLPSFSLPLYPFRYNLPLTSHSLGKRRCSTVLLRYREPSEPPVPGVDGPSTRSTSCTWLNLHCPNCCSYSSSASARK